MDKIDFSRVVVDSSSIRAIGAGEELVRTRRSCTTRHHLASNGTRIVAILTGANRSHVTRLVQHPVNSLIELLRWLTCRDEPRSSCSASEVGKKRTRRTPVADRAKDRGSARCDAGAHRAVGARRTPEYGDRSGAARVGADGLHVAQAHSTVGRACARVSVAAVRHASRKKRDCS